MLPLRRWINLCAGFVFGLTAVVPLCAVTKVGDILKDKPTYLDKNFTIAELRSEVKYHLGKVKTDFKPFKTITIEASIAIESGDKKWQQRAATRFTNLGNGVLREETEYSNNDIPFVDFLAVTYLGMIPMKNQLVRFARTMADPILEIKSIVQFPAEMTRPVKDKECKFICKTGAESQFFSYREWELTFTVREVIPASQLADQLTGEAIVVERESKLEAVPSGRETYYYLVDYGCGIHMKHTGSGTVETYTIEKITVQ
jgi:hypothetical protein